MDIVLRCYHFKVKNRNFGNVLHAKMGIYQYNLTYYMLTTHSPQYFTLGIYVIITNFYHTVACLHVWSSRPVEIILVRNPGKKPPNLT